MYTKQWAKRQHGPYYSLSAAAVILRRLIIILAALVITS